MKKNILVLGLFIFAQTCSYAFNWTSLLTPLVQSQSGTYTKTQAQTNSADILKALADFQSQTQAIDNSVQNSFLSVVSQLSTPQESTILNTKVSSILSNSTQTQEQKNILVNQLISAYTGNLNNNKTDVADIIKNMSYADKLSLANNMAALTQDSRQYLTLAKQGVSTASTLMKASQNASDAIATINAIRQTATNLKARATTVANFVNKVRTISKYAGFFIQ